MGLGLVGEAATPVAPTARTAPGPLRLLREARVADLLHDPARERLEASGVCVKDGNLYVIFDNAPEIACLSCDLSPAADNHMLVPHGGQHHGFEDITFDAGTRHFLVLIEAVEYPHGVFMATVQEHDEDGRYLSSAPLDFPLDRPNKGLTCVRRDGTTYLLGLCEGNRCAAGAEGRRPGGGRVQVFVRAPYHWEHAGTIRLPPSVLFEDYASIALHDDRLAVVSQASSKLWLTTFDASTFAFTSGGTVYDFPRDDDGRCVYCNVEGVSWHDGNLVMVSDRAKRDGQPERCRSKEQSVHVFAVPA
jgi:hypothetical protein